MYNYIQILSLLLKKGLAEGRQVNGRQHERIYCV
nr:MAG TPA: hypothetical protein [Caudoviricetes sp.]